MQEMEIMEIFSKSGAYRQQGHFKLSSGFHSGAYIQCALVLQDPVLANRVCSALARKFAADRPDYVIGPALGGVILAYELARALGARAAFTERDPEGMMVLGRSFRLSPQSRVLIAEDVITTGGSVKEIIELLDKDDIIPVGVAALVDRSRVKVDFGGIKYESLLKLNIPVFKTGECPLCQEGMPIEKPGSRP